VVILRRGTNGVHLREFGGTPLYIVRCDLWCAGRELFDNKNNARDELFDNKNNL
jgi:hypothetical protein